jgi:Mrp family chromosome partitioning ATPase/predicted Fe-Mo cluster-binding NifX family protein
MSEDCNQECDSCNEECDEKKTDFSEKPHELSSIKKVIGVVSGKGGVGKSLVTSMLAVTMNRKGYKSAILDADITGPSIPKAFGITKKARPSELGLFPVETKTGIDIMSINLLLENETDPVVWRGPILAGTVKQFWTDVIWKDVDYMFVDMPPGTGDVPLTVFQSLPVDGIIIVTSPQELVSMIVSKAVNMAKMMKIPVIGLVENMSYFKCLDCGKEHQIFGESNIEKVAEKYDLEVLAKMPIDPKIAAACDRGMIELFDVNWLDKVGDIIEKNISVVEEVENNVAKKNENNGEKKMKIAVASENGIVTQHFGHCENFDIYDVENNKIIKSEAIPNPGHKPGFLPVFLHDLGTNVIISGGMGGGAVDIFNEKGIEVITGATGSSNDAASEYIKGNLKTTGSICHEHQHEDTCEN